MSFAVVVIARNEARTIRACLEGARVALERVGGGDLILVNAGSSDSTAAIARTIEDVRVIDLQGPRFHAAVARNRGLDAVDAAFVQFLDGDMVIDADWLKRAASALEVSGAAAVDGWLIERDLDGQPWNATFGLDWPRTRGEVQRLGGAAMWRTEPLRSLGGFDESLCVGEDPDLSLRACEAGHALLRLPVPMATHDLGLRGPRDWWRRAMSVGRSRSVVAERHAGSRSVLRRTRIEAALIAGAAIAAPFAPALTLAVLAGLVARTARLALRDRKNGRGRAQSLIHGLHLVLLPLPVALGSFRAGAARSFGPAGQVVTA